MSMCQRISILGFFSERYVTRRRGKLQPVTTKKSQLTAAYAYLTPKVGGAFNHKDTGET